MAPSLPLSLSLSSLSGSKGASASASASAHSPTSTASAAPPSAQKSSPWSPSRTPTSAATSTSTSTTTLPSTHPLISELTSLRQQLAAYQKASHVASISLQGARLELALGKEESERLRKEKEGLKKEVEVLRNNPLPPALAPSSTALTQLSLAHRRLSSKLDLTESQLVAIQLELAKALQEVQRLTREREGDRAVLNELKRIEEDREEELEWERGERKKAEHQKKLCDLALQEYSALVHSLDPSAVPPETPSKVSPSVLNNPSLPETTGPDGNTTPSTALELPSQSPTTLKPPPSPSSVPVALSPPETISNLLIGQKGVHQLFNDFTSILVAKDKTIHTLESKVEEVEYSLRVSQEQLDSETVQRVEAESERDKALRDDASASRVVERYMTFTQKTHATVHMHLDNLRTRSQATATTLRSELTTARKVSSAEKVRSEKLRLALDELSEGMSREAAGRRRETALRLKMLAVEEKRARTVEAWLDRLRRTREGAEGAVAEADILESLLDEGVEAVSEGYEVTDVGKDKQRSWRGIGAGLLGRKDKSKTNGLNPPAGGVAEERNPQEESLARILLAEELVTTLVGDLQVETERRMDLERQRVEWLAKEAAEGVEAGFNHEETGDADVDGHIMFDVEEEDNDGVTDEAENREIGKISEKTSVDGLLQEGRDRKDTLPTMEENDGSSGSFPVPPDTTTELMPNDELSLSPTPSPILSPSPLVLQLSELFSPLTARYNPLQKDLHDLSHALTTLRSSLSSSKPDAEAQPSSPSSPRSAFGKPRKSHFLSISRQSVSHPTEVDITHDPTLSIILDGIHEVIEDARVDVEIALADHERVYRGFEALLDVGKTVNHGKKDDIMDQVREYVEAKSENRDLGWKKLKRRVGELESDLTEVKRIIHEAEGMDVNHDVDVEVDAQNEGDSDSQHGEAQTLLRGRKKSFWDGVQLKTVSIPLLSSSGFSPMSSPLHSPSIDGLSYMYTGNSPFIPSPTSGSASSTGFGLGQGSGRGSSFDPRHRTSSMLSTVGSVGRTLGSSVIGAPRRVSGLATGLYRGPGAGPGSTSTDGTALGPGSGSGMGFGLGMGSGRKQKDAQEKESLVGRYDHEDDVE